MDHIIQAVDRAKRAGTPREAKPAFVENVVPAVSRPAVSPEPRPGLSKPQSTSPAARNGANLPDAEVSIVRLEHSRVVAHDPADPQSRAFDVLRTQLLRDLEVNNWSVVAITSPTPECGKTFTALNLAVALSRQHDSSVLLIDLDLKKPQLAPRLGINCSAGIRTLMAGRSTAQETVTRVAVGSLQFDLLACERPSSRSSDWLASPALVSALQTFRQEYKIILLDLPPVLSGDDVISILPQVDCVLMVAAAGLTKTTEIRECANLLGATPVARVVLNKLPTAPLAYDY